MPKKSSSKYSKRHNTTKPTTKPTTKRTTKHTTKHTTKRHRGGGDDNEGECSKKPSKYECIECVEEWYWNVTDKLKEEFDKTFEYQRNTLKLAVDEADKELVNAINQAVKSDDPNQKKLAQSLFKTFEDYREERRNHILEQIKNGLRKEFLTEIQEIKTDPEFVANFNDMLKACEAIEANKY
jgi:hypothetical protein